MEGTDTSIRSDYIETLIKANYIFNNLTLTLKPRVIKASSKSNMAVI